MTSSRFLVIATVAAAMVTGRATLAQQATADPAVQEVRQAIEAARKEVDAYKKAGGATDAADQPAIKWDAAFWAYRERYPRSDAAALASAEAVRLLGRAELWERAHARVASLEADDPAWLRVASPVYDEGIARKDLPYTIDTLSRVVTATTNPAIKSSVGLIVGRAYRRQRDLAAATRALEAAKGASPGTPYAEEADGLIYEIKFLSVGLPAPAVEGQTRSGPTISLASLRGKAVVLVFWGTT